MGMFLSLSAVVGKSGNEVVASLYNYSKSLGGGCEPATVATHHQQHCIIHESNGNTTVVYPDGYLLWDETSAHLSKELNTPVFFFHIHDSDLWMYELFFDGEIVDQFNPLPDYWDEETTPEEMDLWKGKAATVAQFVPNLSEADIAQYLVRWDDNTPEEAKAYETDNFGFEGEQLIDFMAKLHFDYPYHNNGLPRGNMYKLWTSKYTPKIPASNTEQTPEQTVEIAQHIAQPMPQLADIAEPMAERTTKKPWWKFW